LGYRNAKEILPQNLINAIQKYVKGELIYIPNQDSEKSRWGSKNGSRKKYDIRNDNIREMKKNGITIAEIAKTYYLSPESIKKILNENKIPVNG
jgi:Mor family transcriptional regulator